ncbi:NAD(P)H-hydrate dehydratase [Brevundimonas viscosa]|uniref:ADP-dependent (S)-NAD(P)H-hydrate dehydratase n=1 Tax=Brevundimonas viscosa TaxID=871741 RepID=A0A1I6S4A2_9CAUL|nr:NAD(P)H-hydrate dehydratase [Brevundimonas viscosa]SFS71781.1 yjeF C-terminal region, hydroxyethylthiazole kinase-related [Brevundimonas viscosa]
MTVDALPDWRAALPWPAPDAHKHARGRLGVVSGRATQTGAARLAARGGLRIGAGLVRILCPPDAAAVIAPTIEAIMLTPFGSIEALFEAAESLDAVVIGPAAGVNEPTQGNLRVLAETGAVLVVDADGLTAFEHRPAELFELLDRDDVLTPHTGEFERLFPGLLEAGREAAAREAAARAGAVVVLKGPETVIAAPDGRLAVNDNGTPWLATAGTGDVLAGMIGGLAAQRMDSFEAARAAVWMHAEAARAFGPGLIAEDLPGRLPAVLASLYAAHG